MLQKFNFETPATVLHRHTAFKRMAVQRLSPTGNLFRNSRLFSLPPPLISPGDKVTSTRRYDSETATLPYPTHQALETTPSSLARGDWGLKRSLPLKSTARTSTPTIRIGDVDSINHITDFDSAADHVLNLKKWQEIGLPVSKPEIKERLWKNIKQIDHHKSVFESEFDNTQREDRNSGHQRWKYRGPWIAGQTAGELKNYLEQNIKNRKTEFRQFMRERLGARIAASDRRAAIDNGLPLPDQPPVIDEQRLDHHLKELRQEQRGRLFELIDEFLDLPHSSKSSSANSTGDAWVSSESGPPVTHPSAGLSYHRAPSHTFNHPAFGPQDKGQPIRARILALRDQGETGIPYLGLGGISFEERRIQKSNLGTSQKGASKGSTTLDQDVPGGPKIWVHPDKITVDSEGRIKVRAEMADSKTTKIYESSERELQELTPDPLANADRRVPDLTNRSGNTGAHHTYGVNNNSGSALTTLPRSSNGAKPLERREELIDLLSRS